MPSRACPRGEAALRDPLDGVRFEDAHREQSMRPAGEGCFMIWKRLRMLAWVAAAGLAGATPAAAVTKAVGVIGGFNISTIKIDGQDGIDARSEFAIGGVLDLGLKGRFGIRIEPIYLRSGANATSRNAYWGTMDGADFKLDYIGLPVLARYDFGTDEKRSPYVLGGFGFNFAVTQEVELTQGQSRATVDLGDVFSPVDITLELGAGINFPAGTNRWGIDGRVAYGLTNMNDGGTVTFNGSPLAVPSTSTHSLAGRFFVSYLFNL
jgi:opacity protein-like surface antigen